MFTFAVNEKMYLWICLLLRFNPLWKIVNDDENTKKKHVFHQEIEKKTADKPYLHSIW